MNIIVNKKFIKEDILDENGNKLGEIKFNPSDNRIMAKIINIFNTCTNALKRLENKGEIPDLQNTRLETMEDFENAKADIQKVCDVIGIESDTISSVFKNLYEVFGKDTIDIFTGGTEDIDLLIPLLEFIAPHVRDARNQKVNRYIQNEDTEVL